MPRLGILDITGVVVVLVVLFLPARGFLVEDGYADAREIDIESVGLTQAGYWQNPTGRTAADFSDALRRVNHHHDAVRIAGDAALAAKGDTWRAHLAVSWAHADRVEVKEAFDHAGKALSACDGEREQCPGFERMRLQMYHRGLAAGIKSGVDPRLHPDKFREAVMSAHPTARFRGR